MSAGSAPLPNVLPNVLPDIALTADAALEAQLRARIDSKTKPLGSLGRLESLALQLGLIQVSTSPRMQRAAVLVFAGDHGAARAGVSAYPPEVTAQMVLNFLRGGAAINAFARLHRMPVTVVDAGVDFRFDADKLPAAEGATRGDALHGTRFVDAKIAQGTASYLDGAAMSDAQCQFAIERGMRCVQGTSEADAIVFGEMGIGNTASASLLTHLLADVPLALCVGRGTGLDDAGLARKLALLTAAAERHRSARTPLAALAAVGGFEIAMMAGAMLAAAADRKVVLVDGFIATSAALVATRLHPPLRDYCVFAHCSSEPGHTRLLTALGGTPLLQLDLRLGEGTGAALAWPLLQAAAAFLNEMASFESAGVSGAT